MEMEQELEWIEAQKIGISVDLVAVAKRQLKFLAAVDRNRSLYEGPVLDRAIYRYNACWLPLLAKHTEMPVCEGPLVVPLDCEWIWHCHRLNPVQYKSDCEELYGKILDNSNVVSSLEETCGRETEKIWKSLYPEEPYTLDFNRALSDDISEKACMLEKCTKYDLISAVKRQSPFFYQVSRPHMNSDVFLKGALARYKGFLHLIRRNRERSLKRFCVPTYDIDLIWHSHQLNPVSYCKDLNELLGKILEHDDTDSNRTKGMKLDLGFSGTTKQWEETFGTRYWRAGAMYRGSTPTPVTNTPFSYNMVNKETAASNEYQKIIQLPEVKSVEVALEFVEVRNLPEGHNGNLFVSFSKTKPDILFDATRKLTILSESKEKQIASFLCEPTGELLFELISHSPSNLPLTRSSKTLGTTSLSLRDILVPVSNLYVEKWLDLVPSPGNVSSKPIRLRVSASLTPPVPAQRVLHMVHSGPLKNSCFFPRPGKDRDAKGRMHVIDETGTKLISLEMRCPEKAKVRENHCFKKEVIATMKSGETCTLAETVGNGWSLMNSQWSLRPCKNSGGDCYNFELVGNKMVKFYAGRNLDYETKNCEKHRNELDFITAVEFSAQDPYGKAVALLNTKSGFVKVKEEWIVVPTFILFMIFSNMAKEQYAGFVANVKSLEEVYSVAANKNGISKKGNGNGNMVNSGACENMVNSGACNAGGGACGNMVNSGACNASGCGGCGNMVNSGACNAGGCGGGCGNMVNSGACDAGGVVNSGACNAGGCGGACNAGGCGGGCGNMVNSDACNAGGVVNSGACNAGGCGGGCGNMVNSDACNAGGVVNSGACNAGGCGGGCGNMVNSGVCNAGGMVNSGACNAGDGGCSGFGGGGGCGYIVTSGGGAAELAQSDNPCADPSSNKIPTLDVNEAIAA